MHICMYMQNMHLSFCVCVLEMVLVLFILQQLKELEEEIDKLPQEKVKPTRLLRSQQAAAPPPTAAGDDAEEEEEEEDGKETDSLRT